LFAELCGIRRLTVREGTLQAPAGVRQAARRN
jgi:hypothetical protein